MVPIRFGDFLEYREATGTPPGNLMGLLGHRGERGKEREAAPPPLVQLGLGLGAPPHVAAYLSPLWPNRPINFPGGGGPVASQYSEKSPNLNGTIPVSVYNLPIYQSLPLDHFETPRHVRELIRDSKKTSVIKSHNS